MIPAQQGFADLLPKSPGMKMILGLGAAFAVLLTCFACAFIAMPSQGAATATATPATGTVTETSTLTATAVITGTPVITVTPILSTTVPSASPTVTPPSTLPCTIVSGVVFNDLNANRARDQSEPGLAGAAIQLQNPAGGVAAGAVSDSNGAYQVGNFPLGAYRLVVAAPPGFVATTPSEMPLNLFGCSGFTDLNFGFTQPAPPTTGPSPTTVIVVVTPPPPPPAPTTQVVPTTAPPPTVNVPTVPVVTAAPPPTSTFTPTPTPTPSPTPTLVVTAASAEVAWTDGPDVEFKGTISATGEGIVIYQWEHNDGSTSPPQTLTFLNSGTLQVAPEDLWQDNGKCVSSGWARVQVLSPNARTSDPASFQVKCDTSVPAIASPAATMNPNP